MSNATATAPRPLTAPRSFSLEPPRRGVRIDITDVGQTVRRGVQVLDGISFVIEPGEVVAIVGGSGAGKTTLLDAIAGVRPPSVGTVRVDGVDAGARPASRCHRLRASGRHHPPGPARGGDASLRRPAPAAGAHAPRRHRRGRHPHARDARADGTGRRAGRVAQRGAAEAGEHRRRAPHPARGLLPRRADLRPRPGHRPRAAPHVATAGAGGDHRGADHPQHRRSVALRPGRLPGRRSVGVRRSAGAGARALRCQRPAGRVRTARRRDDPTVGVLPRPAHRRTIRPATSRPTGRRPEGSTSGGR